MYLLIAKKEFRQIWRTRRFKSLAILFTTLVVFSMVVSWNYYQDIRSEHEFATQKTRQQWEGQELKNPHSAAHYGTYAFKPISSLSIFDNGLNAYLGVSVFLEAHRQNEANYTQISDQNDLARLADFSPAFVLIYLMPLLIILIGFDVFTLEKERDTLRLLKSQGVSMRKLGIGKALGIWLVLLSTLTPLFLIGGVLLIFTYQQTTELIAYPLIWVGLLMYYAIFINLIVMISAYSKTSNISLVVLLGFWVLAALFVPKAVATLSETIYPTPSAIEYQAQIRKALDEGIDGHNPFSEQAEIFKDSLLKAHNVDSVHKLPFNYSGLIMQAGEEHETKVYQKAKENLSEVYDNQLRLYSFSSVLSPTILIKTLSMQLAQTDLYAHNNFTAQAEKYRIDLVRELNYDLKDNAKYGDWSYIPKDKDFFKKTVQFNYQAPTLGEIISTALLAFTFLVVWFVLSSVGLITLSKN